MYCHENIETYARTHSILSITYQLHIATACHFLISNLGGTAASPSSFIITSSTFSKGGPSFPARVKNAVNSYSIYCHLNNSFNNLTSQRQNQYIQAKRSPHTTLQRNGWELQNTATSLELII